MGPHGMARLILQWDSLMKRLSQSTFLSGLAAATLLAFTGCKQTPRADVAAEVNSRPITFAELDKQYRMAFPAATPETSADQMNTQKLELLRGLIDNEIMLQRAEKQGLMAVDADCLLYTSDAADE